MISIVSAQTTNPALRSLQDLSGIEFLDQLFSVLIGLAFAFGIIYFLFVFVLGAIDWIRSEGDKGKISQARERVTNALIGLIVLFVFYSVLVLIGCAFGINLFGIDIGFYEIAFLDNPVCP